MPFDVTAVPFTLAENSVQALVVACYDGDSFKAVFPMPGCSKEDAKDYRWTCRILGIDTPEIRGKSAREKAWARASRDRLREMMVGQEIRLDLGTFDKYGRVLARPYLQDGTDVALQLIQENLGRAYLGVGPKANWSMLTPPEWVKEAV